MASSQTPTDDPVSENTKDDVDPAKLEALVTPEQLHSANVARKRRTISKKRPSSVVKPRDQTPVRTPADRETTDEEEQTATPAPNAPNAPERKQRRKSTASRTEEKENISKEEKNEQNVKCMSELSNNGAEELQDNKENTNENKDSTPEKLEVKEVAAETSKQTTTDVAKPETDAKTEEVKEEEKTVIDVECKEKEVKDDKPTVKKEAEPKPVRRNKENVIKTKIEKIDHNSEDEEEVIIVKKALKGAPQSEVFALLKQAKRSTVNKAKARLKKSDMAKRSLSSPREKTTTDEDLIESFKKAQLSALQKEVMLDPTSSEEDRCPPIHISRRSAGKRVVDTKKDEDTPSEVSTTEDIFVKDTPLEVEEEKPQRKRLIMSIREIYREWKAFKVDNSEEYAKILRARSKCISELIVMMIFCGLGGIMFKFTEGTFENFYKCGVKRVKRDFIDTLWINSHNLQEERWKSLARNKLRVFEEELHTAHEAGMTSYSGQRSWSFLNGVVYALTVITTIGELE